MWQPCLNMMPDAVPPSACHLIVLGSQGEREKKERGSTTSHNTACAVGYLCLLLLCLSFSSLFVFCFLSLSNRDTPDWEGGNRGRPGVTFDLEKWCNLGLKGMHSTVFLDQPGQRGAFKMLDMFFYLQTDDRHWFKLYWGIFWGLSHVPSNNGGQLSRFIADHFHPHFALLWKKMHKCGFKEQDRNLCSQLCVLFGLNLISTNLNSWASFLELAAYIKQHISLCPKIKCLHI